MGKEGKAMQPSCTEPNPRETKEEGKEETKEEGKEETKEEGRIK